MAMKTVKIMITTFSGSVMCQAALMDVVSGPELALVGARQLSVIGVGVVVAPFLEVTFLRLVGQNSSYSFVFLL